MIPPPRRRLRLPSGPLFPRGLRARLIVAFLVVSAFSALITAALTFRQAREGILDRTQNTAVHDLRAQVGSLAPDLPFPPTTQDLRDFVRQLDQAGGSREWRTAAAYRDGPFVTSPHPRDGTPRPRLDALRAAVTEQNATVYQRTEHDGAPRLTIGMPVTYASEGTARDTGSSPSATPAHSATASGLTVYAEVSLREDAADISALVTAAEAGAIPALALAVVPALLAARRLLRPVRNLRTAAERITSGALDTRLTVTGHDELADLTRTFNSMATSLEENDTELRRLEANARRFAADVSHELRTPLAAMSAVTEVLDEDAHAGTLPPDTADAVLLISDETRKLSRMVEDLMEISRFDAGAAALHPDDVDLRTAVHKTLQLRGWDSPDQVVTEVPSGLRVRVDPRRMDVVLANLVGNALRHGGAPVRVRARTTAREGAEGDGPGADEGGARGVGRPAERGAAEPGVRGAAEPGGELVIEVRDQGPGIPEDVLPRVFDRFYKADAARARSEGSGLGLAIARENVRLHRGTLTAENAPHGGAVFTIRLPLDQRRPDEEQR
ncbi:HAMP domain-containing sensor histidine kinase [Streptomyces sp. NPDC003077]|uniref:sensor histidine kinase n=1 Tax=Streptomyces sp. NPDC003077 TaxID=3154443 RepID=UPI0033BDEA34